MIIQFPMNWITCMGCNFLFARQNISEVGSNPLRGEVNRTPSVWRTLTVGVNLKLPLALLSSVDTQNVYWQSGWLVQGLRSCRVGTRTLNILAQL